MISLARKNKEMKGKKCGEDVEGEPEPFQSYACFLLSHCSYAVMRIAQIAIECILRRLLLILFFVFSLVVPVVSVCVRSTLYPEKTHTHEKKNAIQNFRNE